MAYRYKILITTKARNDIREIASEIMFISGSKQIADKWYSNLMSNILTLDIFPNGNPRYRNYKNIRRIKSGKYYVIYEVMERKKIVLVLRVAYARRLFNIINLK